MAPPSFRGYCFSSVIIHRTIWMYLRFTLIYRDVEDLLAERGIRVSYETIRRWVPVFGPGIARRLRTRRPKPHGRWHLDEIFVRIGGKSGALWTPKVRSWTSSYSPNEIKQRPASSCESYSRSTPPSPMNGSPTDTPPKERP
jgi:hypothetical protein